MNVREWISAAQSNGWRVSHVTPDDIYLRCSAKNCASANQASLFDLGPVPKVCRAKHNPGRPRPVFARYKEIVDEMRRRRLQLGLSQEDVNAAMGMADGYVNKLEVHERFGTFATVQLWADTLGLILTTAPAPLPPATLRAIERRKGNPYQAMQARFKDGR